MSNVRIFEGNPNTKVLTLEVDQDLLGMFEKIVVTNSGALREYSPLADVLLKGDATRVDFSFNDGKTYIAVARKMLEWTDNMKADAFAKVEQFLSGSAPAVYLDALSTNIQAQKPFKPKNPIQKLVQASFNEQVNPVLATDGGAMELMGVEIRATGEITATVALIGSCNGCSHAETETLGKATEKIKEVLEAAKKQNASNPIIQRLDFSGIKVQEIPELVISRLAA
ncbi:MAG: NifU family protein [Pseudomonadota bacterium]